MTTLALGWKPTSYVLQTCVVQQKETNNNNVLEPRGSKGLLEVVLLVAKGTAGYLQSESYMFNDRDLMRKYNMYI